MIPDPNHRYRLPRRHWKDAMDEKPIQHQASPYEYNAVHVTKRDQLALLD
jgi:hypothetical protein